MTRIQTFDKRKTLLFPQSGKKKGPQRRGEVFGRREKNRKGETQSNNSSPKKRDEGKEGEKLYKEKKSKEPEILPSCPFDSWYFFSFSILVAPGTGLVLHAVSHPRVFSYSLHSGVSVFSDPSCLGPFFFPRQESSHRVNPRIK